MDIIKKTKELCPLIHCITNYVTVNDVANVILACGGSPIMADELKEVEEMDIISKGLVLNIGTINDRLLDSMIKSGLKANSLGNIVVLDPVGVGATTYRNEACKSLLSKIHFDVIKGNISEIKAIAGLSNKTSGVDASLCDLVNDNNLDEVVSFTKKLALKLNTIIAITGPIDIISDGSKTYLCKNGDKQMGKVSGTGCMTAGIIASYLCANKDFKLEACVYAIASMGLAGEKALKKAYGTGSLHLGIIDEIYNLDDKLLKEGMKVYEY